MSTAHAARIPPLHAQIRAAITAAYAAKVGRDCPWSGRHARLLATVLASAPSWIAADWLACVRHRFASDLPPTEDPAHWLPSLACYASGPLDRYRRQRGSSALAREMSVGAPSPPSHAAPPDAPLPPEPAPLGALPDSVRETKRARTLADGLLLSVRRRVLPPQYEPLRRFRAGERDDGTLVLVLLAPLGPALRDCLRACAERAGVRVELQA